MGEVLDPEGVTPKIVTFWASMVDCFLQDFQKAMAEGDSRAVMLASAKLGQAGAAIEQWFTTCAESTIESEDDAEAADAAADAVATVVEKQYDAIFGDGYGPDTVRTYN